MTTDEDLDKLLENLPFFVKEHLYSHPHKEKLIEVVMDLGRRPEARFTTGPEYVSQKIISQNNNQNHTYRYMKSLCLQQLQFQC